MMATFFNNVPFFRTLSPSHQHLVLNELRAQSWDSDTVLLEEGDLAEHVFILINGSLAVHVRSKAERDYAALLPRNVHTHDEAQDSAPTSGKTISVRVEQAKRSHPASSRNEAKVDSETLGKGAAAPEPSSVPSLKLAPPDTARSEASSVAALDSERVNQGPILTRRTSQDLHYGRPPRGPLKDSEIEQEFGKLATVSHLRNILEILERSERDPRERSCTRAHIIHHQPLLPDSRGLVARDACV